MRTALIAITLVARVASADTAGARAPEPLSIPPPADPHDQFVIERGEIEMGPYLTGGILASTVGLGIGQAAQGRFKDGGWIFTLGEGGGLAIASVGAIDSALNSDQRGAWKLGSTLLLGGLVVYAGFHIWDAIDAWVVPPRHNRRYRELRSAFVAPTGNGAVAGVGFSF